MPTVKNTFPPGVDPSAVDDPHTLASPGQGVLFCLTARSFGDG